MRRRTLHPALVLVLAGTLATAACSTSSSARSTTPQADRTLRIAGPFEVHSLDPTADGEVFTRLQVTETLVTSDLDGQIVPGLATSWTASVDGRTWTFELTPDVTFHDGTPMTPEAVVASLQKVAATTASPLADLPVTAIRPEPGAVVVELAEPALTLPAVLTHYSTAVLAPASFDAQGRVTQVLGTGPYEITDVELPASITTTVSDEWRGETPAVQDVTFQTVGRAEARALLAVGDQADVVFGLEPAGRERVDASDTARMESSLQPRTMLLKVNTAHPVLGDVRVRRALSLALDREAMAQAVLREPELAATELLPPSLPAWHVADEPLTHDPDEARDLLAQAGFTPDADGHLQRDGAPLELTLLTYPDRPELPALATAIQAALAEIGVGLTVQVTSSSAIPAGHADGTLELALVAKHFALVSDPLVDVATVFAPEGADWGVMGWTDPAVQDALGRLLRGASDAEADAARATVVDTAQEQLPLIPVAWYRMNAAVSNDVEDFVMDPLETTWRITDLRWAR